jgi:hypothetical protein
MHCGWLLQCRENIVAVVNRNLIETASIEFKCQNIPGGVGTLVPVQNEILHLWISFQHQSLVYMVLSTCMIQTTTNLCIKLYTLYAVLFMYLPSQMVFPFRMSFTLI